MKPEDLSFQVIKASELEPGDFLIVKARPEDIEAAHRWAESVFSGHKVRIGTMLTSMEIQIIRENEKPPEAEPHGG